MTLTGYLLSIAGISIATVVIEAVLPEGNMAAFIRRVAALIVVFVIISPLPSLIKKQNFDFGFNGSGSYINKDLILTINRQRAQELESTIAAAIKSEHETECEISVAIDSTSTDFEVTIITVRYLSGSSAAGLDAIDRIKHTVKKYVKIEDNRIFII